jgi:TLD
MKEWPAGLWDVGEWERASFKSIMIAPSSKRTLRHSSSSSSSTMEQQDAVIAASTAIMGENVLDSPNTQHYKSRLFTWQNHSTLEPQPFTSTTAQRTEASQQPFPLIPNIEQPPNSSEALEDSSHERSRRSNALSVGIMAQGLAWAQTQKNRRKQLYLQHQAEQQLEKIRKAEVPRAPRSSSVLEYIPSLQSIVRFTGLSTTTGASKDATTVADSVDHQTSLSGAGYSVELPAVVETAESVTRSPDEIHPEYCDDDDNDTSWIPPVRVEEELPSERTEDNKFGTCPYILTPDEMHQIAIHVLPRNIAYCKWNRCYSLARDGDSFDTCLRALEAERQTLLVVRTAQGARFGGYADAPWEGHGIQGSANYCGGPDACLFRIVPDDEEAPSKIVCYRWTGANRYIQLCDVRHKMLAFGGGGSNGAFGLCLEQDFQYGSSGTCATFDNDPLAGAQEQFQIVDLEIYGFLLGQF